jgi:hypothetical protein
VVPKEDLGAYDASHPVFEIRGWAVTVAAARTDGGGNLIQWWEELQGNTTHGRVRRFDPTGNLVADIFIEPPDGFKFDNVFIFFAGADIGAIGAVHQAISDPNRISGVAMGYVQAFITPYERGHVQDGHPYDLSLITGGGGGGGGGTETVDWNAGADVIMQKMKGDASFAAFLAKEAMNGSITATSHPNDATPSREWIEDLVMNRIHDSTGLYNRLKETMFEVLRENSVLAAVNKILGRTGAKDDQPPPPTPTPPPTTSS